MTDDEPCRMVVQRHYNGVYVRWSATCSTHEQKTAPALAGDFMAWLDLHRQRPKEPEPTTPEAPP